MMKLVIRKGAQPGMDFRLDQPTVRIGRGTANEIALQDTQVSRQHAEIIRRGDQFFIQDLGSTNGTYVNNERVSGSRLLRPGDQVQIGDTVFGFEAAVMAAPVAPPSWEEGLYAPEETAPARGRGQKLLVWGLVAIVALLAVVAAVLAFRVLKPGTTPAPVAVEPSQQPTGAIVVVATETSEPIIQPTVTALINLPTVEMVPTLQMQPTVKAQVTSAPAKAQQLPTAAPLPSGALEQLPPVVAAFVGSTSPAQLSSAMVTQMQGLPQDQLQAMIGALFPGVAPDKLPQVVAASFPGLSAPEIQQLLGMVFPGQDIPLPKSGPIGGRMVLHIYNRDAKQDDLYLANASGGPPTFLTDFASEPDFSPDGQWIVYFSWADDHVGLRLIKPDGTGDTQLTSIREHSYPSFAPDGNRITFYQMDNHTLYVINRDGTGQRAIGNGEFPAWSPVGDQIAYRGCLSDGKCGLMVANADGSNPRQITTHANDSAPRWSPNGGQIAFHSDRDGNWEVYVINVDGSWLRRITTDPHTDVMPVWSPDGLKIAFRSDRSGTGAVWTTSGIGGGAFKQFDADFDPEWVQYSQMDWIR